MCSGFARQRCLNISAQVGVGCSLILTILSPPSSIVDATDITPSVSGVTLGPFPGSQASPKSYT